ncbi:LLM class F420-dependent oxidoreductase [Microbacterium sp. C7(2022)]|uniref:LLM class F420-dependent oxidoreductase n=1 Tax=Microbacterium sp. C7(2022) TaxID=2992759 RepID=UPI00237BD899|nr:LLM class F420-dependent oxidoreductase [Microbacterium sp. C7(2022)]MDE0547646.1 LLM class F420-dependent oxidoreductase [Microbacterium sp. C7(2022)]
MQFGLIQNYSTDIHEIADAIDTYESAGLDTIAVAEAYSFDAVSRLGYLAAKTQRVSLMSNIFQLYTRTPSLTAMTAASLDSLAPGGFTLGIGASGPQVIEGFHGVPYDAPLGRTREIVDICRQVWRRDPVVHAGRNYTVPLSREAGGSGLGKPLKLINTPRRERVPISIAALGPQSVAQVAEIAEGWQPIFYDPNRADRVWGESLAKGLAKRDAALGNLDVQVQVFFSYGEPSPAALMAVRAQLALYIGGMGAKGKNFYNDIAVRYGYEAEARDIQELYLAGRRTEAMAAVPDELVSGVSLFGGPDVLQERIAAFAASGVTTLLLAPVAEAPEQRLDDVVSLLELTRAS